MYVTRVPNRSSPSAVLLRESYRDGGKVKTRTLANLTDRPDARIEALRRVLKGETALETDKKIVQHAILDNVEILRRDTVSVEIRTAREFG